MENITMRKLYEQYYRCGNAKCDSVYHISMLDKPELLCKDCNNVSKVPKELKPKERLERPRRK